MSKTMSEDMYNIIRDEVSVVNSDEGGFNSGHLWRLKNKLRPKKTSNPTAMIDKNGKLITDGDEIKKATLDHYKNVLANRNLIPDLKEHQLEREKLCEERIKVARKKITPNWSHTDVQSVVKNLKKKKSRDPHGYSNEIFQCGGKDVINAITMLMNNIKRDQIFPECLQSCNITSLFRVKERLEPV